MVEMELNKIIIDEKRHDQVIVLREKGGNRRLPIIIGFLEASSIKMKVSGMQPPRPLTHDLLKSVIENLDGKLEKVVVDKLQDNTFHAKLLIKQDGKIKTVDARPSDSIALAVRTKTPIFVEEEVLEKASSLKEEL
ncbi:MAG: bifunctional nuclease family protein [Candidatus Omnitrophica bacterium]|nr:bifunctional nuclease family protein [Candidatus Omnitrophota bacterium]HOX54142.1 bifunctional nuclease family protein [Candidatus Omnitrophota bacterium]